MASVGKIAFGINYGGQEQELDKAIQNALQAFEDGVYRVFLNVEFTLPLFKLKNVTLQKSHALIEGARADYSVHLGSGVVHVQGGAMIGLLPVYSQHKGKLFLPFVDDDPKTSQILSEILLLAEDSKIKDPFILRQISGT